MQEKLEKYCATWESQSSGFSRKCWIFATVNFPIFFGRKFNNVSETAILQVLRKNEWPGVRKTLFICQSFHSKNQIFAKLYLNRL